MRFHGLNRTFPKFCILLAQPILSTTARACFCDCFSTLSLNSTVSPIGDFNCSLTEFEQFCSLVCHFGAIFSQLFFCSFSYSSKLNLNLSILHLYNFLNPELAVKPRLSMIVKFPIAIGNVSTEQRTTTKFPQFTTCLLNIILVVLLELFHSK